MSRDSDGAWSCDACKEGGMTEREAAGHLFREHPDHAAVAQGIKVEAPPFGQRPLPAHVAPNRAQRRERIARRAGRGGRHGS